VDESGYAAEGYVQSIDHGQGVAGAEPVVAVQTNRFAGVVTRVLSGVKTWDAQGWPVGLPAAVRVEVRDGDRLVATVPVTAAQGWRYSVEVPKFRADGVSVIDYRVAELPVPGWTASYNGFDIVNTYQPASATASPAPSPSGGATESPSPMPTKSPTPSPTTSPGPMPTSSPGPSPTPSPSPVPVPSASPTPGPAPSPWPTPVPTGTAPPGADLPHTGANSPPVALTALTAVCLGALLVAARAEWRLAGSAQHRRRGRQVTGGRATREHQPD
jgi:hypothetical protein